MEIFLEMAGDGALDDKVKKKIQTMAKGGVLPGHYPLGQKPSILKKIKNYLAMIKIVILGK